MAPISGDVLRSVGSVGVRPRRRPDRQAITTRRRRRPPTEDRGVSVIVMAWKSTHTPPDGAVAGSAKPRRRSDLHHSPSSAIPDRPRSTASTRRLPDRVSECPTSAQAETRRPAGPDWGGSAHLIRDEILPTPPAATDTTRPTAEDPKEVNEPPTDASDGYPLELVGGGGRPAGSRDECRTGPRMRAMVSGDRDWRGWSTTGERGCGQGVVRLGASGSRFGGS
jgi:hypothetical protein